MSTCTQNSIWSRSSTCARILPGSVTWLFVINLQTVLANIQFKVFIHQYRWEENKRSSLKVSTDQHKSLFRCWSTEDAPVILPEYINLCHLSNLSVTKELIFSVGRRSVVECVISYVIQSKHCYFTLLRKVTVFLWSRGRYSKEILSLLLIKLWLF